MAIHETELEEKNAQRENSQAGPKILLYVIPALLLAGFAGLVFWRFQARARAQAELIPVAQQSNKLPVNVLRPSQSPQSQELTLPGNAQAYVETPIYARTAGYLKKWYVDIGGQVKAGQLLATIDTPEVEEELRQAEAAQNQAQANVNLAKTTSERFQGLLKLDAVSQQEVDQNDGNYKMSQANLNAAIANVQRLKDLQSFQQVTAPFDGVITTRNVDIGALINSGNNGTSMLFREAQIDILRVYVNVPEPYSNDVQPGVAADLHIAEFPNSVFHGKVVHTAGAIDPTSRTMLTEVQVPNPNGKLLPGAYTEVTFHLQATVAPLVLPSTALIFRSAGAQVAVVDSNNAVRLRKVVIGRDFGSTLELISGVGPDDAVIVNPPDSIADGTLVSVQNQAAPQSSRAQQPPAAKEP